MLTKISIQEAVLSETDNEIVFTGRLNGCYFTEVDILLEIGPLSNIDAELQGFQTFPSAEFETGNQIELDPAGPGFNLYANRSKVTRISRIQNTCPCEELRFVAYGLSGSERVKITLMGY